LFELAVDTAPDAYKVKAILSLGALSFHKRDFDSALHFYQEPLKAGKLSAASLHAIRAISHLKSIQGNHDHAIKDLETILPLIKYAPPHIYFDTLNSYAVELGEVGRTDEAGNICKVIAASPFAHAYPEWRETAEGLKLVNRSLVALDPRSYVPRKVLPMPAHEHDGKTTEQSQSARILSLEAWKRKMAKKKEPPPKHEREMLMRIISIFSSDETSNYQRYKIYESVMKALYESENPKPDDGA
jgi:tetratricopeptide (TPR) repeat protein